MTSRKFCYLVVTKDVFPQKQRLPNPSVKVEKIHCICLMTAIPYTCVPQLCKEVSKVCIMKVLEIMKFQEYLSRQVQGIYAGLTISLEWLKLQPTDIKHWSFCPFFLKRSEHFPISAFYLNTSTRETRLMQMCQGFQSHLYWFTIFNNTTVTVRHKRTKAFLGRWFIAGLEREVEELEPSVGFLPSSIQSLASSEI